MQALFRLAIPRKQRSKGEMWPYTCRQHGRPTGLRCSRCQEEPLCYQCTIERPGSGPICARCHQELLDHFAARRRQWMKNRTV
jgi:hypothetical protein